MERYYDMDKLKEMIEAKADTIIGEEVFLYLAKWLDLLPSADVAPRAEWISVKERLPEKSGRYLVYGSFGGMPLVCGAHYDKHNGFGDDDLTHWMPMPEPPKP